MSRKGGAKLSQIQLAARLMSRLSTHDTQSTEVSGAERRQQPPGSDNECYVTESESDSESDVARPRAAPFSSAIYAATRRTPQTRLKSTPSKTLAKDPESDNQQDPSLRERTEQAVAERAALMSTAEFCAALEMHPATFNRHAAKGKFRRFELQPRIGRPRYVRALVERYLAGDPVYAKPDWERKGK